MTFKPQILNTFQCIVSNYINDNTPYRGIYLSNDWVDLYGLKPKNKNVHSEKINLQLHLNKWYTVIISWGWDTNKTFCKVRSPDGSIFKQIMRGSDERLTDEIQTLTIGEDIATLAKTYPFHGEMSGLLVYNNQFHGTNLKEEFRERIEDTMMSFIAVPDLGDGYHI